MDTSETYIKMCDCEEIQDKAPEFYKAELTGTPPFSEPVTLVHQEFFAPKTEKDRDIMIWLPRQDQLQEMIEYSNATYLIHIFSEWQRWCYLPDDGTSMEQLWLAFVMKEKYNKVWDGTNWIK